MKSLPTIRLMVWLLGALFFSGGLLMTVTRAQTKESPLSSQELVRLVYQLPGHPEKRDEIVAEIRRRGIDFALTDGMRSVVATKSGNDALLRRTLEEAARRRLNPTAAKLPAESESSDLLQKARTITLAATAAMPDFVVKQLITRSYAYGASNNWIVKDHLAVAVSYRENVGERYKLLSIDGSPVSGETDEKSTYEQARGASSTGEFVSELADLFREESQTRFQAVDTDTLRGRRAIVYEFEVKRESSKQILKFGSDNAASTQETIAGQRGRIWLDRETYRVLRIENAATDIPASFPITAANSIIDYDWVTINEHQYLLPSRADIEMTTRQGNQAYQSRNNIRFRNYQKFGSEVKIIEDDEAETDEPEKK